MLNPRLVIEDRHFAYLKVQKGSLDKFSGDRAKWHELYERDLAQTFAEIHPFLPDLCWGFLDIGSGLGGIDVLIRRHYQAIAESKPMLAASSFACPYVHLVDGIADPPVVRLHRETFCDREVARDFQLKNGLPADRFVYSGPAEAIESKPFHLVVSFGSWCFHYEPNTYLPKLAGLLRDDAIVIVDLRRDRGWELQLWDAGLGVVAVTREAPKYQRLVLLNESFAKTPAAA